MQCTIDKRFFSPLIWSASKIFRSLSQGLFVELSGIKAIKGLMN